MKRANSKATSKTTKAKSKITKITKGKQFKPLQRPLKALKDHPGVSTAIGLATLGLGLAAGVAMKKKKKSSWFEKK